MNDLRFRQLTYSMHINNAKVMYKPKDTLDTFMINSEVSNSVLNYINQYPSMSTENNNLYYPLKNIKEDINEVEYKSDMRSVNKNYQKLTETKKIYREKQLHQFNKNHLFIFKQPEIIERYAGFNYNIYQKMAPLGDTLLK